MTVFPESGPVFHWFLPTRGDSDTPGVIPAFGDTVVPQGRRLPTLEYLTEVARAAEHAGFHSVLTPVASAVRTPGSSARRSPRGRTDSVSSSRSGQAWRHRLCWPSRPTPSPGSMAGG
jgi:alkanesulfonate monooxygenase SsuD/methylene tetrahydromethanopterin reductase-like flavin-dependent oxidoreductase (luciferase family)